MNAIFLSNIYPPPPPPPHLLNITATTNTRDWYTYILTGYFIAFICLTESASQTEGVHAQSQQLLLNM